MQLEVISSNEEFESIGEEWNALHAHCSASHVPFLRHEYLFTWWQTLGGGEWTAGELCNVIARNEDGELVGIAPLFLTHDFDKEASLLLIGSIEISDYLDFIVCLDEAPDFYTELFEFLSSDRAPAWEKMELFNILEDSVTIQELHRAAVSKGWSFESQQLQPCPYIPLPDDWEVYLSGIDKKQRHEIRRKLRRAESYEVPVHWYIVDQEENLDSEIEAFLELMAYDPEKEAFLTEVMRSQMRSAVHTAFHAGWLQLAFLEVGGEKAAGYLNFDFANHIWVYNSGINFEFRKISPGWVLLSRLIQWAIEQKRAAFDFMRGDEDYKYRFGGINRYVHRVTIKR